MPACVDPRHRYETRQAVLCKLDQGIPNVRHSAKVLERIEAVNAGKLEVGCWIERSAIDESLVKDPRIEQALILGLLDTVMPKHHGEGAYETAAVLEEVERCLWKLISRPCRRAIVAWVGLSPVLVRRIQRSPPSFCSHQPRATVACLPQPISSSISVFHDRSSVARTPKQPRKLPVEFDAILDGHDFLVYGQIGYWHQVHEHMLPSARFVTQPDRTIFLQQVRTSGLLTFTTNAPENTSAHESRRAIPITDPEAHVTFHLSVRADAPERVTELFEWARAAAQLQG